MPGDQRKLTGTRGPVLVPAEGMDEALDSLQAAGFGRDYLVGCLEATRCLHDHFSQMPAAACVPVVQLVHFLAAGLRGNQHALDEWDMTHPEDAL